MNDRPGLVPQWPSSRGLMCSARQRLAQQRVGLQVDLADGQVVVRPPPGVDGGDLVVGDRWCAGRGGGVMAATFFAWGVTIPVLQESADGRRYARATHLIRASDGRWRRLRPPSSQPRPRCVLRATRASSGSFKCRPDLRTPNLCLPFRRGIPVADRAARTVDQGRDGPRGRSRAVERRSIEHCDVRPKTSAGSGRTPTPPHWDLSRRALGRSSRRTQLCNHHIDG